MKFVAHTIKGLEDMSRKELQDKLPGFSLCSIKPKAILFELPHTPTDPAQFRTLDDLSIFIDNIRIDNPDQRPTQLTTLDFAYYYNLLSTIRPLNTTCSITLSAYKNQAVDKIAVIEHVAKLLSEQLHLTFTPRDHANFDIRLMIEKDSSSVLIKVFPKSLFFREYRTASCPGAIRPSIAGAMLYEITRGKGGYAVVDNFCGSGTFLCEARMDGNTVYGGDIKPECVKTTQTNLQSIKSPYEATVKALNATKTPWPNASCDIALSNFPWNKQVKVDFFTKLYSEAIREYRRLLKPEGSICIIGSRPDLMLKLVRKYFNDPGRQIYTIPIGYLGQNPTIIISRPRKKALPPIAET